jgi:hypothetical protein
MLCLLAFLFSFVGNTEGGTIFAMRIVSASMIRKMMRKLGRRITDLGYIDQI